MKKTMIVSGVVSVTAFIAGSVFKTMYWPGASLLLTLGIGIFSLLFLPLLFIIKAREVKAVSDKLVIAVGAVVGILFSLAILFIVQHWPGGTMLLFVAIGIAAFVLLPSYFFTGIRKPETRLNTILMSIILTGVIGLQFTIVRLRPSGSQTWIRTATYAQSEDLLRQMLAGKTQAGQAAEINEISEQLKAFVLQHSIGMSAVPANFDKIDLHLNEGSLGQEFNDNGNGVQLLVRLHNAINTYNASLSDEALKIPIRNSVLETDPAKTGDLYSNLSLLNSINQLQMYVALAENNKALTAR